jgi:hypothetical protein
MSPETDLEGDVGVEPTTSTVQSRVFCLVELVPHEAERVEGIEPCIVTWFGRPGSEPSDSDQQARVDDDVNETETPEDAAVASLCRVRAAAVFTHTTPVPSSLSISPVQYT